MKNADFKEIRNIAILSHGAAGKTSLADAMLFAGGAVDLQGSVDSGTSVFMHEPEELARKITITAALGFLDWKGVRFHIIDTPGYINFLEETRGTLRAVDGAILIVSAISGVKAETEKIYKYACDYEIPRVGFVSKLDKERADFFRAPLRCAGTRVLNVEDCVQIGRGHEAQRRHQLCAEILKLSSASER